MFIFNDTATTEIYTLSLHDALPISQRPRRRQRKPSSRPAADSLRLPTQQPATRTPPPSRAGSSRTLCPQVAEDAQKSAWPSPPSPERILGSFSRHGSSLPSV